MKEFLLTSQEVLPEINGTGYLYKHSSGAQIVFIQNEDKNRVFSASFKTPPTDSSGMFHILEHCVLNGSRKYPLKEPFYELSKGTLHTYLNAMTYKDKTMYPIASTNEKEFFKMTDIYLDSVFFPIIYERPEILLQEGFHFETDKNPASGGGVVYNEMKGAYGEPDRHGQLALYKEMFEQGPYRYDSGGSPEDIPGITYDEFINSHKKHYHPSNSYIYFYGDLDIEKYLNHLHNEYLSKFSPSSQEVPLINSKLSRDLPKYIELERKCNKDFAGISICFNQENGIELALTMDILCRYLFDMPSSPGKLLLADYADQCSSLFDYHMEMPVLNLHFKGIKEDIKTVYKELHGLLKKVTQNELEQDLLNACINSLEFKIKEENFGYRPRGLQYNINMMPCWMYGGNPFSTFSPRKVLNDLKTKGSEYFIRFIKNNIVENRKYTMCLVRNGNYELSLPEPDENADNNYEKLKEYHKKDFPSDSIPSIAIDEIEKNPEKIPFVAGEGLTICPIDTNEISYLSFMFEIDTPDLIDMSLLNFLLGKLDTKNFSYTDLTNQINTHLGSIKFTNTVIKKVSGGCSLRYIVSVKALDNKIHKAFEYVNEIITNTRFDDENRITTLINEHKSKRQSSLVNQGHVYAIRHALMPITEGDYMREMLMGVSYYQALCRFEDKPFEEKRERLEFLLRHVFNRNNFSLHITGKTNISKYYNEFCAQLPQDKLTAKYKVAEQAPVNEHYVTNTTVYYNALAFAFDKQKYSGLVDILPNILNSELLMENIRIKGGAYGFGSSLSIHGDGHFYSYRDPNIEKTFEVFDKAGEYISSVNLSQHNLKQHIIGAINKKDRPVMPSAKGKTALHRFLQGITYEDIQRHRWEILSADTASIRRLSVLFEGEKRNLCTFGGTKPSDLKMFDKTETIK